MKEQPTALKIKEKPLAQTVFRTMHSLESTLLNGNKKSRVLKKWLKNNKNSKTRMLSTKESLIYIYK